MSKAIILVCIINISALPGISQSHGNPNKIAEDIVKKALEIRYKDLDSSIILLAKAVEIYSKNENWKETVECLNYLTVSYHRNHNPIATDSFQNKAIKLAEEKLDPKDQLFLSIYSNACNLYRLKEDFEKSLHFGKKALTIISEKDSYKRSIVYQSLSFTYIQKGDYIKAKEILELSIKKQNKEASIHTRRLGPPHYALSLTFEKLGEITKAIENLKISVRHLSSPSNRIKFYDELVKYQIKLSELHIINNELAKAQLLISEIENNNSDLKKKRQAEFLHVKALHDIKSKSKNLKKSIEYLKQSNEIFYESLLSSNNERIIKNNRLIALAYEKLGKIEDAKAYYLLILKKRKVLDNFKEPEKIVNKIAVLEILNNLFGIEQKQENHEVCLEYVDAICGLMEAIRLENSSSLSIEYWASKNLSIVENLISYLIDQNEVQKAFSLVELNKSNLLYIDLKNNLDTKFSNIPKEIIEEEANLKRNILSLKKTIFDKENQNLNREDITNLKLDLSNHQFALESLIAKIEVAFPEYYTLKYKNDRINFDILSKSLTNNQIVIEYFVGQNKSYIFGIRKDQIVVHEIKSIEEVKIKANNFYQYLKDPTSPTIELNEMSSELYKLLLKDVIDDLNLKKINEIIIVPDDILSYIPLGLLRSSSSHLIEEYNVYYQYSTKLWMMLDDRVKDDTKNLDFLGYAYENDSFDYVAERDCQGNKYSNLLCSKKEIDNIMHSISDKKVSYASGTLRDILGQSKNAKIFHLATHACYDTDHPQKSKIIFNEESITYEELQLESITSNLVVISACESGYGEVIVGEGSMTIAKSFFHAGAASAVVSLWPVDDCATSQLMTYFYDGLEDGLKKDHALRKAKSKFVQEAHRSQKHPYYWAGFILIGDNDQLWDSNPSYRYFLLCLAIILIILIIIKYVKRLKFS